MDNNILFYEQYCVIRPFQITWNTLIISQKNIICCKVWHCQHKCKINHNAPMYCNLEMRIFHTKWQLKKKVLHKKCSIFLQILLTELASQQNKKKGTSPGYFSWYKPYYNTSATKKYSFLLCKSNLYRKCKFVSNKYF